MEPNQCGVPSPEPSGAGAISALSFRVRREQGRTFIDGVRTWTPRDMPNSVIAAEVVAMQAVGENVTYAYQMGASGCAFRLQVAPSWCPSSPHLFCGHKLIGGAVAALPYRLQAYEAAADDAPAVARTRAAVKASIDRGVPCQYGNEEDGLIVGYQKDGTEWVCVHPWHKPAEPFVETAWPWGVGVFMEKKLPPPDRRESLIGALKTALRLANLRHAETYDCGLHAWRQWMAALYDDALFRDTNTDDYRIRALGNSWILTCLIDARRSAAEYLLSTADLLVGQAASHLKAAATHYRGMVEDVLSRATVGQLSPSPEDIMAGSVLTNQARHAQASMLSEAFDLEQRALAEIHKALSAEKINISDC